MIQIEQIAPLTEQLQFFPPYRDGLSIVPAYACKGVIDDTVAFKEHTNPAIFPEVRFAQAALSYKFQPATLLVPEAVPWPGTIVQAEVVAFQHIVFSIERAAYKPLLIEKIVKGRI